MKKIHVQNLLYKIVYKDRSEKGVSNIKRQKKTNTERNKSFDRLDTWDRRNDTYLSVITESLKNYKNLKEIKI